MPGMYESPDSTLFRQLADVQVAESAATSHLASHGTQHLTWLGRTRCARALVLARRVKGREHARWLRARLHFISGALPRKSSVRG